MLPIARARPLVYFFDQAQKDVAIVIVGASRNGWESRPSPSLSSQRKMPTPSCARDTRE